MQLKAGKVKLIPKSKVPNGQTKELTIFTSLIDYYKVNAKASKATNTTHGCICITLTNLYIFTKIIRQKKYKVWKLFNSPNVNVLKILFITSCRLNDDVILHFTKEMGGDTYLRCHNYKGELISVLQMLHRVKLDKELKVIMVNESESEMLQKYFRRDRTDNFRKI